MTDMPLPQPEENDNSDVMADEQQLDREAAKREQEPSPDREAPPTEFMESTEAQLPPEARGEANGGPLGCCLGIVVGLLLTLSIAIISRLYATPLFDLLHGWLSITVRIVMILVGTGLAIAFGYVGWRIGKRAFREYELSPQQKQRLERLEKAQRRKQKQKQKQRERQHIIMP